MLKSLHKDDTQITPFITTKNWELSNVANEDLILMEHSGSDGLPVALEYIDYGIFSPVTASGCNIAKEQQSDDLITFRDGLKLTGIFYPESDPQNLDGTYQRMVYAQVIQMFYNNYRDPTKIWGMEEIDFDKSQTLKFISDKFKIFRIPQDVFGEKILENTVKLFDRTTDNDYIITDDGHCNLFAGTNLFSHDQEIGDYLNEYTTGSNSGCVGYNNLIGSGPTGVVNPVTANLLMDVDFSNPDSVFSDISFITSSINGGIIRGVKDTSGNNNHWLQSGTSSLCPIYRVGSDNSTTYSDWYNDDDNYHLYYMLFSSGMTNIRSVVWVMNPWGSPTKAVGASSFLLGDSVNYNFHSDDSVNGGYFHSSYSTVDSLWTNGTSRNPSTFTRLDTKHVIVGTTTVNSTSDEFDRDRLLAFNTLGFRGFLWRVLCYSTVLSVSDRQAIENAFISGYSIV